MLFFINDMLIYILIFTVALSRFVPHMPNFVPLTALAIFSSAYLSYGKSLGFVLMARFISDWFLGFFAWPLMLAVYVSHAFGVVLGAWIARSEKASMKILKIGSTGFISATVFFLVTNFAFFYDFYPHSFSGIVSSYVNALPFLKGTLLADVGYTVALFSVYEALLYIKNRYKKKDSSILALS